MGLSEATSISEVRTTPTRLSNRRRPRHIAEAHVSPGVAQIWTKKGKSSLGPSCPGCPRSTGRRDKRIYYSADAAVYSREHARKSVRSSATQGEKPSQSTPPGTKTQPPYQRGGVEKPLQPLSLAPNSSKVCALGFFPA